MMKRHFSCRSNDDDVLRLLLIAVAENPASGLSLSGRGRERERERERQRLNRQKLQLYISIDSSSSNGGGAFLHANGTFQAAVCMWGAYSTKSLSPAERKSVLEKHGAEGNKGVCVCLCLWRWSKYHRECLL